jgi:DNA-binding response OmpR family regulator
MSQRILLVEDDTEIRLMLRMTLQNAEFFVRDVSDGLEAISVMQREKFDAVVLDIAMPRLDGIATLDALQLLLHERQVPIIAVSAMDEPSVEQRVRESGAVEFLHKPFDPNLLLEKLRAHLPTPLVS